MCAYDPPLGELRWRIWYGGRAGAKSWQIARGLLIHGCQQSLRILCVRQYQASIKESVHKLLALQIKALGLEAVYEVQDRTIINRLNGTEFIFRGIHQDPDQVKSLEAVDVCWVEEGQLFTADSWAVLIPTIRKEGSEIWVSFNPGEPDDPTWQMLVEKAHELPRAIVTKVTYRDNPFASSVTIEEAEKLRRTDPDEFEHVYEGVPWQRSDLQVFAGKYRVADLGEPQSWWGTPLYGSDFGFSQNPSLLLRLYVFDSRLYIQAEAGGIQLDNDELARRWSRVPGARQHMIEADSARPETINELRRRGFKIRGAPKWPGSVEDGIQHIRGEYEEVVISPACPMAIEDFRLYRYKADPRTGNPTPLLVKKHDHAPDAVRYALTRLIRRGSAQQVWWPGMDEPDEEE